MSSTTYRGTSHAPEPGNMPLGATRSADLAGAQARMIGTELRAMGMNANFAPVAEVNTNPQNPIIGVRSFGEETDLVAALAEVSTRQMQASNVSATPKHFPGHGDTDFDTHFQLSSVTYGRETLEEVHLPPFKAAIDAGADMVMTAHVIVEAIDPDLPATLSRDVLTGVLREQLGFDGIIVTDAMGMDAIDERWGAEEAAIMAFQAGADVILMAPDLAAAQDAMLEAVRSGEVKLLRLNESVRRILEVKYDRGLFDDPYSAGEDVFDHVGIPEHLGTAAEIARRAATLVRNDVGLLPLDADGLDDVLVTGWGSATTAALAASIEARGPSVDVIANPSSEEAPVVAAAAEDYDLVVTTTSSFRFAPSDNQRALVEELHDADTPMVVLAVRNP